jgi:NADPH2:quinone reductase
MKTIRMHEFGGPDVLKLEELPGPETRGGPVGGPLKFDWSESSGVGTAVQLAANHGCIVFGTAGTTQGLELVKKLRARESFNHRSDNCIQQIIDRTSGRGVDLIIEFLADKNLDKDLSLLAKRGRVVVVGNRGRTEIDARQTMAKDSDIRGMSIMHADGPDLALIHAALGAGLRNGTLTPIVGKQFQLADAAKAHEAVMEGGAYGKIILSAGVPAEVESKS